MYLEHLSPDENSCLRCHKEPLLQPSPLHQDHEKVASVGLASHMLMATRHLFVLAFHGLQDACNVSGTQPPEPPSMKQTLMLDTLAEMCRSGHDWMMPLMTIAINGVSTCEHACRTKSCVCFLYCCSYLFTVRFLCYSLDMSITPFVK